MRKLLLILIGLAYLGSAGCALTNLKTPCPHYGSRCSKTPVNNWDNH